MSKPFGYVDQRIQMSVASEGGTPFLTDELPQGTVHVLVPQTIDKGVHHGCHHGEDHGTNFIRVLWMSG